MKHYNGIDLAAQLRSQTDELARLRVERAELDAKIARLEANVSITRDYLSIPEPVTQEQR